MVALVPLQVLEGILLNYHVGHVLVLLFVLTLLGAIPLGSRRVISLTVMAFGLLFVLTPVSVMGDDPLYIFFGVALLVVSAVMWAFARD